MNNTSHNKVLDAFTHRAINICGKTRTVDDDARRLPTIDETGTLDLSGLNLYNENYALQQEMKEMNDIPVPEEVLQVHGFVPPKKADGTVRLIYENVDGINTRLCDNEKVERMKGLHDDLEVDVAAYCEHKINFKHKRNINGFNQLFKGGEAAIQSITAHNVHENFGKIQQGGTSLILFGHLTQLLDPNESGKDPTGLGRWTVMTLQGEGVRTRIICGYNPCVNYKKDSGTSYQQHRRFFIRTQQDLTCPRKKFHDDLMAQLKKWREEGDRLIVCMDANENIYRKSIGRSLTEENGLKMSEVIGDFTGKKLGATFFRGSKPIDGVWATRDLNVTHACVMPTGFGVGDHRMFIVDLQESSVVGATPFKVQRYSARRLNTKVSSGAVKKYVETLEKSIEKHRLIERLDKFQRGSASKRRLIQQELNKIDRQSKDLMLNAEKKCRRIKSGRIPFSPEAALWIRRSQVYRSLVRYHDGLIRNRGNLKRTARRCGIERCFELTMEDILLRLKVCLERCDHYRKNGKHYRRKHLNDCLARARDKEDSAKEKEILEIIQREKDRSFWRRINWSMGKARNGSVWRVLVENEEEGSLVEHVTRESIEEAIFNNIHRKRFFLAEAAPACNGRLRGLFGYNAATVTAERILNGTYKYPDDFDRATREICEECASIRLKVPKDSIDLMINSNDWKMQWRGRRETTSSSESGLHFGHYIAGCESEQISHLHALKSTLVVKNGIVLDRWARGLSVMLEKIFGCALITKLRSILLMEADFNATNKIVYGNRMLHKVRQNNFMPEEIYSEKNRLADDGTLVKVLFYDIVRQTRLPAGISAVDADNCYDRIAHPIASLVFQALGIKKEACESIFTTIQDMKFFLRTGYGDSKEYASATGEIKTQGMCQGNGAAPAGWTVDSIVMINAHKRKGHGLHLRAPITNKTIHLAGALFVDDMDVEHLDLNKSETRDEAHQALQNSIINWGHLLIATGGALKPAKCFFHIISFSWKPDGTWRYDTNEAVSDLKIFVPLAGGTLAEIEHLPVSTPTKTLGQMTCPTGSSDGALKQMCEKAQKWIDKAKEGRLQRRNLWFLLDKQFWPGVAFGISSITASFDELDQCMMKTYYGLLSISGVRRSIRKELRQMDRGFYGCGFPHPGVECFIAQISKLLTNYGCNTGLGIHLQTSMELMVIECGVSCQILAQPYRTFSKWVTHCWLKSVWEKVDLFNLTVTIKSLPLRPPRENDEWMMILFKNEGYTDDELVRLNRVRCHQQVLFYSDIFDIRGRSIHRRYRTKRPIGEKWSDLIFPNEKPPGKDLRLWNDAIDCIAPRGIPKRRLGRRTVKGHKIWPHADEFRERDEVPPTLFWQVLLKWERTWMWENIRWEGDDNWISASIRQGTCIAVTDGSYMRSLYPDIHSAAFVLECTSGTGRIWGSFPEPSRCACSYRGELVGLMAIHLILLATNEVNVGLQGRVQIYSDCLGALDKVKNLPPARIPTGSAHSDVLKNILVNCSDISFDRYYSHVSAHQDDHKTFTTLTREAQLNCSMDYLAKKALWDLRATQLPVQQAFPLEPICIFAGTTKITADMGDYIRFWSHRQMAKETFHNLKILFNREFEFVDWEMVYGTLRDVPRLFQLWACKQVMGIAGTMEWDRTVERKCPSCTIARDTCAHVLSCTHEGRVEALKLTLNLAESWLEEMDTDPDLLDCIMEYAHGRGGRTMENICEGLGSQYQRMAREQDAIGWRRFMEGMISKEMRTIQYEYYHGQGLRLSSTRWAKGLILKLLETTHGQWIYRNVQIHDNVAGTQATLRKEAILKEIEEQMELGDAGLLDEDHWMLEVNLGDLETYNGEQAEYWLVGIRAGRMAYTITSAQKQTEPQQQDGRGST